MKGAGEGPLSLDVTHTSQLIVEGAELGPFVLAGHPDEGWEIERCIVAHILIIGLHRCIDEEVCDALINRRAILERRNEGPYVLEGRTTHDLRGGVQKEAIVELLEALGVTVHRGHLSDLSNDICTCFANLPLLVLGQRVV